MTIETLIWLIPLPPILAFFLITVFTNRSKGLSHSLAIGAATLSWLAAMLVFFRAVATPGLAEHPLSSAINWFPTGGTWFRIGVQVDPLQAVTLFFVAWTVLMIFIYSVGYHNYGQPKGDHDMAGLPPHGATIKQGQGHSHQVPSVEPMYSRFFAFISLFAFAMFTLVVSDNLLLLYVGWEVMGLCSYLLIGFWYGKSSARDAAMKAFITTRIGDVFMLLGLAFLYTTTGTLSYREIFGNPEVMHQLATTSSGFLGLSIAGAIAILLFIGTVGKSAQFPLHVWLPDAMEGPTPVSAMIHVATMVSAGVYLALRFFPLASAGWVPGEPITPAMTAMALIGSFTALFASTIAVAQRDIKRVLAYSTISQLGYMVAALGVGAYAAAAFHLVTHAFFKALLFLGSGSVIHGMEHGALHSGKHDDDPQDMFNMGGLRKKMPVTFWTFLLGGLALSGFPLLTAGFWSKDEILSGAFNSGHLVVFITLALAALLTAFYTMRQITLTFLGKPRTKAAENASENKWTMTFPLVVLAFFAVTAGWVGIPKTFPGLGSISPNWFETFVASMLPEAEAGAPIHSYVPLIASLFVALGGLYLGYLVYRKLPFGGRDPLEKPLGLLYPVLRNKYGFDQAYDFLFVRTSHWLADIFTVRWLDKGLIDGFLHAVARGAWGLGVVFRRYFDLPVINRGGDALSNGVRNTGFSLKAIQTGRVQQYLVMGIALVVALGIFFYYLLVLV
jgi:NADH-quinone oxidoreductase subunit L